MVTFDVNGRLAAAAFTVPDDLGAPPPRERAGALAGPGAEAWGGLRPGHAAAAVAVSTR